MTGAKRSPKQIGEWVKRVVNRPEALAILAPMIVPDKPLSWTRGGCCILAMALQEHLGRGELVMVMRRRRVVHVVLRLGRSYIDADGAHSRAALLNAWSTPRVTATLAEFDRKEVTKSGVKSPRPTKLVRHLDSVQQNPGPLPTRTQRASILAFKAKRRIPGVGLSRLDARSLAKMKRRLEGELEVASLYGDEDELRQLRSALREVNVLLGKARPPAKRNPSSKYRSVVGTLAPAIFKDIKLAVHRGYPASWNRSTPPRGWRFLYRRDEDGYEFMEPPEDMRGYTRGLLKSYGQLTSSYAPPMNVYLTVYTADPARGDKSLVGGEGMAWVSGTMKTGNDGSVFLVARLSAPSRPSQSKRLLSRLQSELEGMISHEHEHGLQPKEMLDEAFLAGKPRKVGLRDLNDFRINFNNRSEIAAYVRQLHTVAQKRKYPLEQLLRQFIERIAKRYGRRVPHEEMTKWAEDVRAYARKRYPEAFKKGRGVPKKEMKRRRKAARAAGSELMLLKPTERKMVAEPSRRMLRKPNPKNAQPYQRLINECQKRWTHYCERPSKKRLKLVYEHLEVMKASKSKKVAAERRKCLRSANAEAKRLGVGRP